MCRMLMYKGEPIPLDALLVRPEHSLVCQSRDATYHPGCGDKRNIRVNGDGFGVAWYVKGKENRGSCVLKSTGPAWNSSHLINIAEFMESSLIFGHVRAASNTGNLEAGVQLVGKISEENCHPFKFGVYTFMHNGGIPCFNAVRRKILACLTDDIFHMIGGSTDSEHIFSLILNEIEDFSSHASSAKELSNAVLKGFQKLLELCAEATGGDCPAMSLNICLTDGVHTIATRYRNSARQQPPSMYFKTGRDFDCTSQGEFKAKREGTRSVVLCSEPLTKDPSAWALVPKNHMVVIEGRQGENCVKNIDLVDMEELLTVSCRESRELRFESQLSQPQQSPCPCPILSRILIEKSSQSGDGDEDDLCDQQGRIKSSSSPLLALLASISLFKPRKSDSKNSKERSMMSSQL
mmetsp:Transcript_37200/g.64570  ORF Transcript_37200/g.64570 Transcript_37200/m.64570 type:complete len:407 (-) Transcript_37200:69-1289(-)